MQVYQFNRSYIRFFVDFQSREAITLSHEPPTTCNRVRIAVEAVCKITEHGSTASKVYTLGASCKSEIVGPESDLWVLPCADFCLIAADDEFLILKSWHKNNAGVMRNPPTLGSQPERQADIVANAWDELSVHLHLVEARALATYEAIEDAVLSGKPIVSRIEYSDGTHNVVIDQPVKTINVCEREKIYQTDTGPILLPDLSEERISQEDRFVGVFDLAFSAFNRTSGAEFIIQKPTPMVDGVSVNHYSVPRRIHPTTNTLFVID